MKRNYELHEFNECLGHNFAAKAANYTNIRTHSRRSRKIYPIQFVSFVKTVIKY